MNSGVVLACGNTQNICCYSYNPTPHPPLTNHPPRSVWSGCEANTPQPPSSVTTVDAVSYLIFVFCN